MIWQTNGCRTVRGGENDGKSEECLEEICMKKDLGVKPYLFPMPVLLVATYGDGDTVDVMNMA